MYNKADWRNNRTEKGFCMKEIRTEDAVGHILCHDITQIIKDEKKRRSFQKGACGKRRRYTAFALSRKRTPFLSGKKKKESFMKMRRQKFFTESVRAIP
mgnify:CR=1 FL=1